MTNVAASFLLAIVQRLKRGSGVIINEHTLSPDQTRLHVEVLRRWFDLIKLQHLPARLLQHNRKPFCLLTFDDGKRSNFSETAPELERLRAPAVFYVTTGALTSGSWLWFDQRQQLIRALGRCPAGLELGALKQLALDQILERIGRACSRNKFEPQSQSDDLRPMSWDEARSLNRRGFAIGAHGVTHAILTRETKQRAYAEIDESIAKVTQELSTPCRTFAFPNGNYTQELAQHALHCGAETIMTTDPAWVDSEASLWRLPRVQLFGGFSRARIETKIALAAFKGFLPNPDGSRRKPRFGVPALAGHATPSS